MASTSTNRSIYERSFAGKLIPKISENEIA